MTYILMRIILLRFINSTKTFAEMASKIPTMDETTTTRISTYVMSKHIPRWLKWFCKKRKHNQGLISRNIFPGVMSKHVPMWLMFFFVRSVNLTKGRFTNDFFHHISNSMENWFQLAALSVSYRCEIKHMPIQHICRAMCKMSQRLLNYNMDESSMKFPSNLNYDGKHRP